MMLIRLLICTFLMHAPSFAFTSDKPPKDKAFTFGLIGDLPYFVGLNEQSEEFNALIKVINNDRDLQWVIHVGDIKRGSSPCTDEYLLERKARFDKLRHPFILTPGDNEWTDCHRFPAGGFDPLERLQRLREIFFDQADAQLRTRTQYLALQSQQKKYSAFVENMMWEKNSVVFSTIHFVGSQNGLAPFKGRKKTHDQEVERRTKAAINWLRASFERAENVEAKGLFVTIHANPGLKAGSERKHIVPFKGFMKALKKLSAQFAGQVVLAHGDTHEFQIDKPFMKNGRGVTNLTRVETFGESDGSWIKVSVDPESPGVFAFSPSTINR